MKRIIEVDRSVIVAADVPDMGALKDLVSATIDVPGISGYKVGFSLGLKDLGTAVTIISKMGQEVGKNPVIIYDHQKAGNDIPATGEDYAHALKCAGIDVAILFPFAGPATQEAWTKALQDNGIGILTGGVMTHEKFLVSEGGYIDDDAVLKIYELAADLGVRDFVVPGKKIEWVKNIRAFLDGCIGTGKYVLYAPGFITQGGDITECGKAAGNQFHAIVGSAIYKKNTVEEMREAAMVVTKQIAG